MNTMGAFRTQFFCKIPCCGFTRPNFLKALTGFLLFDLTPNNLVEIFQQFVVWWFQIDDYVDGTY